MPVDIEFELGYLLSDKLGTEVEVVGYTFDPETGRLCIEVVVEGVRREGCIEVKPCKGLKEPSKQARCISKTLMHNEKLVEELASNLKEAGGESETCQV